jgi:hypothetical protein
MATCIVATHRKILGVLPTERNYSATTILFGAQLVDPRALD